MNKEYNQIKLGLVNYIGAMMQASNFESDKAARQYVSATLIEEALNLMHDEDKNINMFVAKPLLRATAILLNKRIEVFKELSGGLTNTQINSYEQISKFLKELADNIKE